MPKGEPNDTSHETKAEPSPSPSPSPAPAKSDVQKAVEAKIREGKTGTSNVNVDKYKEEMDVSNHGGSDKPGADKPGADKPGADKPGGSGDKDGPKRD